MTTVRRGAPRKPSTGHDATVLADVPESDRWPGFVPTLAELEIAVRAAIRLVDPERPIPVEEAIALGAAPLIACGGRLAASVGID